MHCLIQGTCRLCVQFKWRGESQAHTSPFDCAYTCRIMVHCLIQGTCRLCVEFKWRGESQARKSPFDCAYTCRIVVHCLIQGTCRLCAVFKWEDKARHVKVSLACGELLVFNVWAFKNECSCSVLQTLCCFMCYWLTMCQEIGACLFSFFFKHACISSTFDVDDFVLQIPHQKSPSSFFFKSFKNSYEHIISTSIHTI